GRGPLPPAQTQLVAKQLLAVLYRAGQIDWQQVRALLAPLPGQPAPELDLPTRQWLTPLAQQPGLTGADQVWYTNNCQLGCGGSYHYAYLLFKICKEALV